MRRTHYYEHVPGLGNLAISRHAQWRMDELGISQPLFERILLTPEEDVREAGGILCRCGYGVRIVIIENPSPFRGAKLVKTVYRVEAQAKAHS